MMANMWRKQCTKLNGIKGQNISMDKSKSQYWKEETVIYTRLTFTCLKINAGTTLFFIHLIRKAFNREECTELIN